MSTRSTRWLFSGTFAIGTCFAALSLHGEPPAEPEGEGSTAEAATVELLTVDEARGRARLLQKTYEAALHVIHRRYFDADEKETIPAKALEDVFRDADEGTGRSTRWIAVSTPAMNVDNTPREGFETAAAEALQSGQAEFESVEDGVYRRAGPVRLFASCLKCHESGLTKQITKPRFAGIVMEMPLRPDAPRE